MQIENYIFQLQYMTYEKEKANHMLEALLKQENIQYDLEAMLTEGKIKAAVPVKRTGQWDRRESMSEIQDAAQIIKVSFGRRRNHSENGKYRLAVCKRYLCGI